MSLKRVRGAQFVQSLKRSEWVQGVFAPLGVATQLPILLADKPQSRQAVRVSIGTIADGRGRLVVLGLDYEVDVDARSVTWLPTARWELIHANIILIDYWTQGWFA